MSRRLHAPTANGSILAEPGFDAVPPLVEANRNRLDSCGVRIGGTPLRELRHLARQELLGPDANLEQPLLLAGHQPELSHPGVWAKNFALHGLAKKLHGIPLNLIVDNDTLKIPALRVPTFRRGDPASVHVESVRFDALTGQLPYENRAVVDVEQFRSFPDRVAALTENWGFEPLLAKMWRDGTNIGEVFTQMRHDCERRWGCADRELPVSRLVRTAAFRRFVGHILDDLPRFRECYNAALRAYRQANGIRSANHPAPDLAAGEAPFWEVASGRRQPVVAPLNIAPSVIRPRALTLTLFARLCLGDFFIHGIGGGKYDEATDGIIRDYFGIEPPAYQVLSATLHLPLPGFAAGPEDVQIARRLVRDLRWNPQRHIAAAECDDPPMMRQVADRIAAAAAEPPRGDRPARRTWYRRLQELNERLQPHVAPAAVDAEMAAEQTEREAAANAILRRRDYSWVLYPEAVLKPFLQRFL